MKYKILKSEYLCGHRYSPTYICKIQNYDYSKNLGIDTSQSYTLASRDESGRWYDKISSLHSGYISDRGNIDSERIFDFFSHSQSVLEIIELPNVLDFVTDVFFRLKKNQLPQMKENVICCYYVRLII